MAGFDAPYVPGWDCHGMPIEVQIEKTHGKNLPTAETQRLARAYASTQIARQKADFQRLGVLGDWDHPYTTMAYRNEADEIRTLGEAARKGLHLPRPEAGQLVLRLPERARRGRSRVRGPHRCRDRRRLSARRRRPREAREGVRAAGAAAGPGARRHLDHDAVDDAGQPGAQRPSGFPLRAGRNAARHISSLAEDLGRRVPRALQARGPRRRARRWARRWSRSASGIRSTIARRRSTSATT